MNVVPGQVTLGVDIRDIDGARKTKMVEGFKQLIHEIEQQSGCQFQCDTLSDDEPVILERSLQQQLMDIAAARSWRYRVMPSGAGHDAMHMARIAPTALIFIPSRQGISHNIAESSSLEDIVRGMNMLYEAVLKTAIQV